MNRSLRGSLVLVFAVMPFAAVASAKPDIVTDRLAMLKKTAGCSDPASVFRSWCIATNWATGTVADLPKGKVLVGLTIELATAKDEMGPVTVGALAIDAAGKVKLTDIKATNKDEEKASIEAVFNLANQMKGKSKTAKLPADFAAYVKSLKGTYATTRTRTEWTWTGASPARMRKVGEYWVVIELPKKGDGIFATILTEAWE